MVTKVPLIIPISAPTHKGTRIAATMFTVHIRAARIPHTATMAPTDKSMHPVMITNVIPTAMTPIMLDCLNRFIRLIGVKNCLYRRADIRNRNKNTK